MRIVTLVSGGMDSATLLHHLIDEGHEPIPVALDYGQRHWIELHAARAIVAKQSLELLTIDLRDLGRRLSGSALTDPSVEVPEGHYADETMKATVVPNRNLIFLSIAAGIAVAQGADGIAFAAHAGDHPIYPDCRRTFVQSFRETVKLATDTALIVVAPFLDLGKHDICRAGMLMKPPVPYDLTWSCYRGVSEQATESYLHCGRCGTCVERKEAFEMAGFPDPTRYEDETAPRFISPRAQS